MKKFTSCSLAFLATISCCFVGCNKNDALKEKYSQVYANVSQEMLNIATNPTGITATAMKPTQNMGHVFSTGAFLYFVSELYKSDAFLVSDKPVLFTCSYEEYGDEYSLAFRPLLDEDNQKVLGEFYVETKNKNSKQLSYDYIYIDVDYNFSEKEILAFDLYMCEWDTAENVLRSLYQNGILQ